MMFDQPTKEFLLSVQLFFINECFRQDASRLDTRRPEVGSIAREINRRLVQQCWNLSRLALQRRDHDRDRWYVGSLAILLA
jgi:hypothetical protein